VKDILARAQEATLLAFAQERVLIAFDFDGTLAPIVRDPKAAAMRARTARLLAEVARLYPCAVLSGRARADVMAKVDGIPLRAVFGNHGMEPSPNLRTWRKQVARWHAQIAAALPPIPGVAIENKGVSLAIHYRQARARKAVHELVLEAVECLRGIRIVEGKMVVNILPAGAPNKGSSLISLRNRLRCNSAIYVGDDDNDEDVFALAGHERLLGIRVGHSRRSQASYFLLGQSSIDLLLAQLAEFRQMAPTRPARPSIENRPPTRSPRAA
jgi:trehalose 6-phosphate phosphatase